MKAWVVQGKLFFQDRIVVPKQIKDEVMEQVHSQHHFGKAGTLQLLRKNFFWVGMDRDVEKSCPNCLVCHKSKPSNKGKEPIREMCGYEGIPGYAVASISGLFPGQKMGIATFC